MKRLYRSKDKILGGVCGGIADHLDIDPSIARILTVLAGVITSFGPIVLVYIIAWIVIPEERKMAGNNSVNGEA